MGGLGQTESVGAPSMCLCQSCVFTRKQRLAQAQLQGVLEQACKHISVATMLHANKTLRGLSQVSLQRTVAASLAGSGNEASAACSRVGSKSSEDSLHDIGLSATLQGQEKCYGKAGQIQSCSKAVMQKHAGL